MHENHIVITVQSTFLFRLLETKRVYFGCKVNCSLSGVEWLIEMKFLINNVNNFKLERSSEISDEGLTLQTSALETLYGG